MKLDKSIEECLKKIGAIESLKKCSKEITKENFKTEYDKFRTIFKNFISKIPSSFQKEPVNIMERDEFFLSCMYTVCSHKSDKISFYKRANQMKTLILSYVQGVKSKYWEKYLKKIPYNDKYTLEKNRESKNYLKTIAKYLKPVTRYFVSLCKCLGKDENSAKKLEYSSRADIVDNIENDLDFELSKFFFKAFPPFFGEKSISFDKERDLIRSEEFQNTKTYNAYSVLFNVKFSTHKMSPLVKSVYNSFLNVKRAYRKENKNKYNEIIEEFLKCSSKSEIYSWVNKYSNVKREVKTQIQTQDSSYLKSSSKKSKTSKFRKSFSRRTGFKEGKTSKGSNEV